MKSGKRIGLTALLAGIGVTLCLWHGAERCCGQSGNPSSAPAKVVAPGQLRSEDKNARGPFAKQRAVFVPRADGQTRPDGGATTINWAEQARFVPGELLVRFKRDAARSGIKQALADKGVAVRRQSKKANYSVISVPDRWPVREAAAWFRAQGAVEFAEPNYLLFTQEIPDDARYHEQWAPRNIGAEAGWDLETGVSDAVVAVIDTGVDYAHPDLADNIWQNIGEDWVEGLDGRLIPGNNGIDDDGNGFVDDYIGWDFVDVGNRCADDDCRGRDNDPMDGHGHGTHVAGIAGAVTDNGLGIAGIAWHCRIMAVRAGYKDSDGKGVLEVADAADAVYYAADNGARVLNLSWGGSSDHPLIREAVQYASESGVIICAAAGNSGSTGPFYPAGYPDPLILAVGSTDSSDIKAQNSNYGLWVDVSAPGVNILSACPGDTYCDKSGTSMAAPHVAGLTALLLSRFPGWSPFSIVDIILDSVRVVEALNGRNATSGIIDLEKSLDVDARDLAFFLHFLADHLGRAGCSNFNPCEGDLDGDGDVDGSDLAGLAQY